MDNIEAAKRMVEHRLGVAFLPRTAIIRSVSAGNLALISVQENPGMTRSIVALKRRDAPTSGPVDASGGSEHPGRASGPGRLSPSPRSSRTSSSSTCLHKTPPPDEREAVGGTSGRQGVQAPRARIALASLGPASAVLLDRKEQLSRPEVRLEWTARPS